AGCATSPATPAGGSAAQVSPSSSPTRTRSAAPASDLPRPDAPIPKNPAKLAAALKKTDAALKQAIGRWDKKKRPPEDGELLALAHPVKSASVIRTRDPRPAAELLRYFKQAERRFGVEWEVLAAVMFAETKFGRVRSASHVGAQGPMQFMPGTWKQYGMGGDVHDHRDSVMAAANYLRATGAPKNYQRALHAYNPSQRYVNAILLHAEQIKRDPAN